VKHMNSHKSPAIQPREVVSHLRSISRSFRLGRQEDSHEFLRFVMELLQANDLASYGGSKKITDLRVQETTALFGIFGGYFRSQVKCLTCNYRSNTYDAFLDLSLEVNEVSSVTKALHSFTRPEKLDAENLYRCAKCAKKVRAEKQLSIFKAPTVLCVHLKRFQFAHTFGGKINKAIQFNERLSLEAHMSDRASNPGYSLYAVLVHSGHSIHSGHYYCYVKSSSGQWHCMDDSSVRQVGLQHVLEQRAYMLFYVRDRIETLPIAAPSPAPSPSMGPLANAAAAKKVAALNLDAAAKKLATVAEQQQQQAKKKPAPVSSSDEDEEEDEDDDSYSEGDSDEEDESADEQASVASSTSDASEESDAMSDVSDASSASSVPSDSSIFDAPTLSAPEGRSSFNTLASRTNLMALGLIPSAGGFPRLALPRFAQRERDVEMEESDEDDEPELEPQDAASRKRKRLIDEMMAEVADLSEDEDEESESDDDEEEAAAPAPTPKSKSRPESNSEAKRPKLDATAKENGVQPKKPTPAPFYFSASSEAAAAAAAAAGTSATPAAASSKLASPKPSPVAAPKAAPASVPTSSPAPVRSVSREPFDPRFLTRQFASSQFGTPVGDWESTVQAQEQTREKYAMKRKQDIANAKLTPQVKQKDQWDEELDKGHVRKVSKQDKDSCVAH
jgi:hypothetical protein